MAHISPGEVAYARAGGRMWLIAPAALSSSLREPAAAAPSPIQPALIENLADQAAVRRLYASLENPRDASRRSRVDLVAWLRRNLDRGVLVALDISIEGLMDSDQSARRQQAPLTIPGGLPASSIFFTAPFDQPSRLVFRERCIEAIMRAAEILTPMLRRELFEALSPERLTDAATAMTRWAESQSEQLSSNFDTRVFSAAYELAGWPAFSGMDDLADALLGAREAMTDEALQQAAVALASAIEKLGVEGFLGITDRAAAGEAPPAGPHEDAIARWAAYIDRLAFPPTEVRRACLWGELSARAQAMAQGVAQRDGLFTLAEALRSTDFLQRYMSEFGPMAVSPVTRRVWELLALRWTRSLQGEVTLIVDEGQGGAAGAALATGDTPAAAAERSRLAKEQRLRAPAMRSALGAIAAARNPLIVSVKVVDVAGGPAMPVAAGELPS